MLERTLNHIIAHLDDGRLAWWPKDGAEPTIIDHEIESIRTLSHLSTVVAITCDQKILVFSPIDSEPTDISVTVREALGLEIINDIHLFSLKSETKTEKIRVIIVTATRVLTFRLLARRFMVDIRLLTTRVFPKGVDHFSIGHQFRDQGHAHQVIVEADTLHLSRISDTNFKTIEQKEITEIAPRCFRIGPPSQTAYKKAINVTFFYVS